ncbi:protein-disulfide reductase DsbD family protein [Halodesulfovibrio marinisediminis]|uniref:Thiol:disulfide interchange protein DsbD n=1 Tax=Halodesulfovibrio marinisediminis DSM 17456 TaxID=1121457 RepID=A0A1N6DHG3_9BACT|nr:cytochrome c biogenesis protein CcdA [Halodesulfovibrio marinisediminis]SIN70208.1 thiol:disulfide interchange protein DsbD [Halodesulfovibrio marinisediminis DSM 17456]
MKQTKLLFIFCIATLCLIISLGLGLASTIPASFSAEPFFSATQNDATVIKLRITPDSEYHFYSREKGETGKPTSISVSPSIAGTTVRYPAGIKAPDPILTNKTTYLYEGAENIFITIPAPAVTDINIIASLLLCSDVRCTPVHKVIPVSWKNTTLAEAESQQWWNNYLSIKAIAPDTATHRNASSTNETAKLAQELGVQLPSQADSTGTPLTSKFKSKTSSSSLSKQSKAVMDFTPKQDVKKHEYTFTPRYFLKALEVGTLGKAILLGLLAGFILNLMPCVLPVISLKLTSLLVATRITDKAERTRIFREHNLFFALGILTWFSLLTIVLSTFELAWGQLFQNQGLLIALVIVIFALALSIFDIFPLPMFSITGHGPKNGNDRWSAFSTGLLATLLATPCSGPFLGGVLGWALLQPISVLILIFLSIGVGMALPYFAMAMFPTLVTRFPHPGAWTHTLSQLVGFFLMGTVVYLLLILPTEILPDMLIILWVTTIAAWAWGRFSGLAYSRLRNILIRLLCILLVAITIFTVFKETPKAEEWKEFTPDTFFSELHHKRLVVDFTADWCPNCKVLEQTVLTPENRARWKKEFNVTFVQVDMTNENVEQQKFLESLGSSSIPVVAIFPKGKNATSPIVLRDIFTTSQMEEALKKAFSE